VCLNECVRDPFSVVLLLCAALSKLVSVFELRFVFYVCTHVYNEAISAANHDQYLYIYTYVCDRHT